MAESNEPIKKYFNSDRESISFDDKKYMFNRFAEEKSCEFQNFKEKINPDNLMYKYKTEGRSPKNFSDRFIYNFQERWCKPKRSIRSRRSIKRKSKIKIKRPNKCYIKCSKFFWLKRKNYYFFKDYSILISEAKYKAKHGEGLKILSPKQMFQKLLIAMAQVNAGNTSENLCNEIRKIMYFLYR